MAFYRVGMPLIMFVILALIILAAAIWWRKRQTQIEEEEDLEKRRAWEGVCHFDNPQTGAKCQREEFHLENHYRDVNGRLVTW